MGPVNDYKLKLNSAKFEKSDMMYAGKYVSFQNAFFLIKPLTTVNCICTESSDRSVCLLTSVRQLSQLRSQAETRSIQRLAEGN